MIIDKNFEEILKLAFQKNPTLAKTYATNMMEIMTSYYILSGQRGRNEYELDEPDEYVTNNEKTKLEELISELDSIYSIKQ